MPDVLTGEAAELMTFVTDPTVQIVMHLGKNAIPIDLEAIQLSDFVECDFPGYAPVRLTDWNIVPQTDEDFAEAVSEYAEFVSGDVVEAQNITCVYVTMKVGAAAVVLLWPLYLDTPLVISKPGQVYRKRYRWSQIADQEF